MQFKHIDFSEEGEYAEIQDNDTLYIHESFMASVLLTKEEAIKLGKFITENFTS